MLEMVRLGAYGNRRRSRLSGDRQQRAARAGAFDPELALMDEPLSALDKQLREQMQIEIRHIHDDLGVTVIYVTHGQGEALTMSDRTAVFNDIQQPDLTRTSGCRTPSSPNSWGENNRLRGKVVAMNGAACNVEIAGAGIVHALANVEAGGRPTVLSLRPERVELNRFSAQCLQRTNRGGDLPDDHVRIQAPICGP
ncbi:hypothetical protein N2603_38815 [Bradyrhizobium huanghuaihaiense]|uniref:hypothetical protein n=1 Tax=Bradyrhizobium huanghuaihaiense TaxID=990078 RepID=UPI0021A99398|nr:hypothetical protein [Bradyrhizobium sp. CB3035]UWU75847.1 hypothetical protein N2603_38815 [Bradyrhizobium sp. CB3035]